MLDPAAEAENRARNKTKSRPPWSSCPKLTGISTAMECSRSTYKRQRWVGGVGRQVSLFSCSWRVAVLS